MFCVAALPLLSSSGPNLNRLRQVMFGVFETHSVSWMIRLMCSEMLGGRVCAAACVPRGQVTRSVGSNIDDDLVGCPHVVA